MGGVLRRILIVAAAIAVTLGVGTAGFVAVAGYPVFDAFYMALITMTTVGYAEIRPLRRPAARSIRSTCCSACPRCCWPWG